MSNGVRSTVDSIYRYPVKGLTPEKMDSVTLAPGETLPFDRAFAIENGPGRFDPANPRHLPKITFLMLMRDERLATLDPGLTMRRRPSQFSGPENRSPAAILGRDWAAP